MLNALLSVCRTCLADYFAASTVPRAPRELSLSMVVQPAAVEMSQALGGTTLAC